MMSSSPESRTPVAALESQLPSVLALLALANLLRLLYRRSLRRLCSRQRGCRAATSRAPVRDPFVGLDFVYDSVLGRAEDRYLESSLADFRRLGPTFTVRRWSWEVMYTCDARNIKHLLAGAFDDFALPRLRVSALGALLGRGIFTLDGPAWAHARSVLKPLLARLDREAVVGCAERHVQAMLRLVPADSDDIDLQPLFFRLTMDFAADYLMGGGGGGSASMLGCAPSAARARAERFVDDYMACSREVVKKLRLGPLQHLRLSLSALRARRRVFRYVDDFVDDLLRRAGGAEAGHGRDVNVLTRLAAVTRDRRLLRDQVLHILLASRDTTASTLSNLFFVLARDPAAFRKLRDEVRAVAGQRPPTAAQLKQMEYLRWCVNESPSP
ncbi:hypothetical protein CDD83_3597 [Cordyceps sp. RAO-2017]|nr:hypothetical protein CDD83_3597 [Cordyceps sp. RAO-2017]